MRLLTPLLALVFVRVAFAVEPAAKIPALLPTLSAESFDLADVILGPGPFRDARERDRSYLLSLDPDRLLHTFRLNVNLPSSAQPYGGWESPTVELRGHSIGHYLSACALMYRSTGDAVFKQRVDYIVAELARCQAASPAAGFHQGYLSAFPESFIDRVEARKEVWAPWYTLHKIMAGLLDAHQVAGNPQALDTLIQMAGWIQGRVDHLTYEQMQASLQTEFGGMNEVLANLYGITSNPVHLRLAQTFDHALVFDPLARGEDALDGLHANTQIPKIIGAAREFELTGNPRYRSIALTFWDRVALHRSYVIGGHSDHEHFFAVTDFASHLSPETTETCNTYNMLKLTRHLFAWQPDARLMDFYERGLYNHILASQDPAQGTFVYLMSLEPGHFKTYSTAENSFWCCVGTGMENHAKYGDTIFSHGTDVLFVNLFIPAEVHWRERGISLRQETIFPNEDTTRLFVACEQPTEFALRIRHPSWAAGALAVSINGHSEAIASQPGSYFELKRTWQNGDRVEVRFPFALHVETLPGNDTTVALLYGPIVLAGKLGIDGMPSPYARDQLDQARIPPATAPCFVTPSGADWLNRVELVSRSPLLFRTRGLAQPNEVVLEPLYQLHHERYTVYWKVLTPAAWETIRSDRAAIEHDWKVAQSVAIDQVNTADETSENAHAFKCEKTNSGQAGGRGWRQAHSGGYFSYDLKTGSSGKPLTLVCALGSQDFDRKFTLWLGDHQLGSPHPDISASGQIYLARIPLPASAIEGRQSVTIKFQSDDKWDGATATVFGLALVKSDAP
jgi:DUF1680 family protein